MLEALNTIGMPEGDLIAFLVHKLNISSKEGQQQQQLSQSAGVRPPMQPFVFLSSVLILALNSLKQITIPEPGQAIHKGVSCALCHAKHIIGWRYKCGHCIGEMDFDEKCVEKHLEEYPDHVMLII